MNPNSNIDQVDGEQHSSSPATFRIETSPETSAAPLKTSPETFRTNAGATALYRSPWLWAVAALLLALIGVSAYFITQSEKASTADAAIIHTSVDSDNTTAKEGVESAVAEPALPPDPYEGWSTFKSRIAGVSFRHPAEMIVEETLATDKNNQGYDEMFTTIVVRGENQDGNGEYIFRISDMGWSCIGPSSWTLTYRTAISDQSVTLNETCSGMTGVVAIEGAAERATLVVNTQYLLEDKGDFDMILGSMTGISVVN